MTGKRGLIALCVASMLLLTACGQYRNVHARGVASGETGGIGGAPGDVSDGGVADGGAGVATDPGAAGGQAAAGEAASGGQAGDDAGGGSGGSVPTGGDATGVTANAITLGIHAPLTGAAPLKASSFNAGKGLYWERGNDGKAVTIFGRRVRIVFNDDQYNPSHATQVCKQMAERDKAFALLGGGGTDQIQACAQYAAGKGIPYLSAGVTENRVKSLDNYFAFSMSYPQQAPLLAKYIKKNFTTDSKKVAVVATNTANFSDAVNAFTKAFPGVKVFRPDKNARGSTMAANLCTGSVKTYDVVFPLAAPTYYLEMAKAAKCQPQYVGVGVTMGLDQVARTGCEGDRATEGARFFSPTPAFADSDKFDPDFRKAAQAAGQTPDDIMWLLWASAKVLHQTLENAGQNLTREGFIAKTERASFRTGIMPPLAFTPSDHFGSSQVHVLRNVCSGGGRYVTEASFKSSF